MALPAGTRLGRYEIIAPLGAGGMGEVYRARDSELDREVALKIVPEALVGDPERLARFKREAQAVARLSHPNILEIFDFGTDQGISYAVTELLEGQTLRERLSDSPLSWRQALPVAAAVAEGLAAAHGGGVVHRDLKPENIHLGRDGRVKILDFGLARFEGAVLDGSETEAPTFARTAAGTILGTVGYMSPEQVLGEQVDSRSDIFSLGCVAYEMVTGQRAFAGKSAPEVLAAVLKEAPPSWASLGVEVPAEVGQAVLRCLEKAPSDRFQSASDLAFTLRAVLSGSQERHRPAPDGAVTARRWQPRWLIAGGGLLLLLAGVVRLWWMRQPQAEIPPLDPERVLVVPLENRTGDPTLQVLGQQLVVHREGLPPLPAGNVAVARRDLAAAGGPALLRQM